MLDKRGFDYGYCVKTKRRLKIPDMKNETTRVFYVPTLVIRYPLKNEERQSARAESITLVKISPGIYFK